jgi:hypothetical protein
VIITLNVIALYYILTKVSPDSFESRFLFCLLLVFLFNLTYPLIITIFKKIIKTKEELNLIFRTEFKKVFLLSFAVGILYFMKISQIIGNKLFLTILIVFIGFKIYLSKYKNSKKRLKY